MVAESPDHYDRTVAHERDVTRYRHSYPDFDYEARVDDFARRLESTGADAAVLPNAVDLAYYAGTGQPANLYVPAGDGERARLFVRRAVAFANQEVGLPEHRLEEGGLSALAARGDEVDTLGLPFDAIPASLASKLADVFEAEPIDVSGVVSTQRAVKADGEIELLTAAAELYEAAHEAI